jgi:hypothetical protein
MRIQFLAAMAVITCVTWVGQRRSLESVYASAEVYGIPVTAERITGLTPEALTQQFPGVEYAPITNPLMLHYLDSAVVMLKHRGISRFESIDARLTCILRSANGHSDTLAFGRFQTYLNGKYYALDSNLLVLVGSNLSNEYQESIQHLLHRGS